MNGERTGPTDLMFAIFSRYIEGVFKPFRWYLAEYEQLDDSIHLNKNIRMLLGRILNPLLYINFKNGNIHNLIL